jgi:hypothetical protein
MRTHSDRSSSMEVSGRNLRPTPWLAALVACAAALALHACGGGGVGSNGTGAAPEGSSAGTVTGFGSVIVDGVRFDDSMVVATRDDASGTSAAAELKLGQHVELGYDNDGQGNHTARSVSIAPSLIGPVSAVSATTLTVLRQVVQVNTDPAIGPVTLFEAPYAALADIKSGDWVEIHAVSQSAGSAGAPNWLATRIEPISAQSSVRVSGRATAISTTGQRSFKLGALTVQTSGQTVWSAGTSLVEGQSVVVFAPLSAYQAGAATLSAQRVRVLSRDSQANAAADYLAGWVSDLTNSNGLLSFVVDGVQVTYSGSAVAGLTNGVYALVQGQLSKDGDQITAASVVLRYAGTQAIESAELHGTVIGWDASTRRFKVRDVTIDASALLPRSSKLDLSKCVSNDLADDLYLDIKGQNTAYGVRATSITCTSQDSGNVSGEVVEFSGSLSALKAASRTFTLTTAKDGAITVRWTGSSTYFRGPLTQDGANLANYASQTLQVEGSFTGTGASKVLRATKIKLKS